MILIMIDNNNNDDRLMRTGWKPLLYCREHVLVLFKPFFFTHVLMHVLYCLFYLSINILLHFDGFICHLNNFSRQVYVFPFLLL